jgi:hypothetical protein
MSSVLLLLIISIIVWVPARQSLSFGIIHNIKVSH